MAYTALEKMRVNNQVNYGKDVGPAQPTLFSGGLKRVDLKSAALRFLHERCEELKFDTAIEKRESESGELQGSSIKLNQIPYNMQMDINRLCLEKSLERFIDSGVAEDAYDVYYSYLEIFFGHYGKSKKMVELLSEFEYNGSSLLMKHRDHYSHSVYVFALGLAIYETNSTYRRKFKEFYGINLDGGNRQERKAANLFLEFWGLTALFHDIGYPFELPFEQVISYFEVANKERGKGSLYIAYHDLDVLTKLGNAAKKQFKELYQKDFESITEILAYDIAEKLGQQYEFTEDKTRSSAHADSTAKWKIPSGPQELAGCMSMPFPPSCCTTACSNSRFLFIRIRKSIRVHFTWKTIRWVLCSCSVTSFSAGTGRHTAATRE